MTMLSPHQILEYWECTYQTLTSAERIEFVARPEILRISLLPDFHVHEAIKNAKQLDVILKQSLDSTMKDDSITDLERTNLNSLTSSDALTCPHQIKTFMKCAACREVRPFIRQKTVWMSAGGKKFHYDKNCEWARAGQDDFRAKGGEPLHWFSGSENIAKWDREPCYGCVIHNPLGFSWIQDEQQ